MDAKMKTDSKDVEPKWKHQQPIATKLISDQIRNGENIQVIINVDIGGDNINELY